MSNTYFANPAMFRNHPIGFLFNILLIPVFGLGLGVFVIWFLKCKSTKVEIKNNDILLEKGLLSKDRTELSLKDVRTVNVKQSFSDRLFGVGSIDIFTAGDEAEMVLAGLPHPYQVRDLIRASKA